MNNIHYFTRSNCTSRSSDWTEGDLAELLKWCEHNDVQLSTANKSPRRWNRSFYSVVNGTVVRKMNKFHVGDTCVESVADNYAGDNISLKASNGCGLIPHIGSSVVEFLD